MPPIRCDNGQVDGPLDEIKVGDIQGSKIVLVRSYLQVSQAAGQVNILIFLLKIKFSPCMPINFVMQGKCIFSDISRPDIAVIEFIYTICHIMTGILILTFYLLPYIVRPSQQLLCHVESSFCLPGLNQV